MSTTTAAPVLIPLLAWLKQYGISKSSFYRRAAEMPPVIRVGRFRTRPGRRGRCVGEIEARPGDSALENGVLRYLLIQSQPR